MYIYVHTLYYENLKSFGHCSPYIQLFEENCFIHIEAEKYWIMIKRHDTILSESGKTYPMKQFKL